MEGMVETACRVCGLDATEVRFDQFGSSLHVICDCCGTESGYGDENVQQVRRLRSAWLRKGTRWNRQKCRPANWDLQRQLADIPPQWR